MSSTTTEPTSENRDSVPGDGTPTCPPGFSVKATDRTGLYHVPGDEDYEDVVPSTCFRDEQMARRGGYRRDAE